MHEPLQPTDRSRIDTHKLIWAIGALLVAIMAAAQVYDVLRRRAIVLETTERTYASLARSLADQTQRIILAADVALRETGSDASSKSLPSSALRELLGRRPSASPQLQGLVVLAADGKPLARAGTPPPGPFGGQIYFTVHRDNPAEDTYFSAVFRRRDNGHSTLAMSRRIASADGSLSSVAVAFLDLDYFARLYESVDLGPGTEVGLLDSGGRLLARFPDNGAEPGRSEAEAPAYRGMPPAKNTGTVVGRTQRDGREITYAIQPLAGLPLAVVAAVDNAMVLKPWNVQAVHSAVRTSLFCLSVLLLLTLVLRQLRRREQAEASLRVQTALLDELFESAPEAIVMLDLEQRVTRVNREFTRMFGSSAEQALGRSLTDLIVPDELQRDARLAAQAVHGGRHTSVETERMRSDGSRVHVSELSAPITVAGTNIAGFAIYRDITERRLAEAERTKLESRLRQAEKLEAIGTMAGGIAHDFNSILTAILGYGEMARNAAPETGAMRRYVSNVLAAANRAKALVDQILTYSRTTRGKHTAVNPRRVVQETLGLVRASLPVNIELKVQLLATRTAVIADPTQIHQLVMNLCTNAAQAMRSGGILSVTLDTVDTIQDRELSHGLLAAGHYVRLSVRDTGCGIDPDVLQHIFEPFFTTKESGRGTGLGLALVQGILSELGGAIDVASEVGSGSAFHLYLPRSDDVAAGTLETVLSLPKGAGERVLLVEDEKPLMLIAEEMLAALGYEPAGFTRPSDALDEFRADPSRFDAVMLDYLMPEMTGTELTKQLRTLRADIPIILVSGYEGPVLLQQALSAGIEHVITKPLALQQLAEMMANALTRIPTH
jgi:PAS domain S-box-containing protein